MNRRYVQIMLGLGLLFIGMSALGDGNMLGVLMGLGGFYLLARQFEETRNNRRREQDADREYARYRRSSSSGQYDFDRVNDQVDRKPTTNANRVYSHALEAVQAAGLDASTTPVLPVDLGVFAHRGGEQPKLYRTHRLPKDVDYVQPFVQLRLPTRAKGRITFDILDDRGEVIFTRTEEHELKRGRNLVVPSRRIPVHDALNMDIGSWTLRVSADGTPIALHDVKWQEQRESTTADLDDDGEISTELRAAMAESRLEEMSLDELLSFQDENAPAQQQQQSAQQQRR